jgi:hypothetical protein
VGEVSYKGHRYPAEIIAHCVWLYHRFPLSFREVEELLLVRGMIVSYETIALRQNRCSRSEICGDGVRSVSVEVPSVGPYRRPGGRRRQVRADPPVVHRYSKRAVNT